MPAIPTLILLMVKIACIISQDCSPKVYNTVRTGGLSLLPDEIVTSHTINSGIVPIECYEFCQMESRCVGFNYREVINVVNCQLTNITGKGTQNAVTGEWMLMLDEDAANNDQVGKEKNESLDSGKRSVPSTLPASMTSFVDLSATTPPRSSATPEASTTSYYPSSTQTTSPNNSATSCTHMYNLGVRQDGVYTIDPDGLGSFQVRCDMSTDGGGWTVFQRRQDGSQDFYLGWSDYKAGFGDLNGEFWLGLDKILRLYKSSQNVLRVELMDFKDHERYAKYGKFSVADESDKYKLVIGSYSGNAGDSLDYHNQMKFSTKDSDNDASGGNCATDRKGAWWYNNCYHSNLNGLYPRAGQVDSSGIRWVNWHAQPMKKTQMKTRQTNP